MRRRVVLDDEPEPDRDDREQHELRARAQAERAALDDLHVVVDEADQRAGEHRAEDADRAPVGPGGEDRERRDDGDHHDDAAHRRRPRLAEMPLRPVVADVLAELAPADELDELRREEDADEERGGAADQDLAHQPASARSVATRSSPTPREPLTSTVSPARRRPRRSDAPPRRVGRVEVLSGEALTGPRRARADRDEQLDARRAGLLAQRAVVALLVGRAELQHVAQHRDPPRRGPWWRDHPARPASTSGWRCSSH